MVNKEHPDFLKYKFECDARQKKYEEDYKILEEKNRQFRGKDGEIAQLTKKCNVDLKKIKEKYSYLFD